ncbi:hypothetical protein QYM36_014067 [Artemia franciscana]|uniref:Immunoglobulin I-set domain-containing protein n=1 Tax=Artemia franciscana TaxID=6661 RepID=A0AA88L566_ARTSF|nr:hypothetical protein QYM36_014067 [Artemia franciscana]
MQRNQGLVPVGGTTQQQQTLMSQQRNVEQRSTSSSTTIRESHTRASETHVSQQSFASQQQSTITSQRVQGMLVQPQQQTQHMIMGQRLEGLPPVFEQIFRNARFAQGGNALFEGKVKGNPTPEVSWTRQGQSISDSNKYQMKYESQTGKVSLLISLIGPGDEGLKSSGTYVRTHYEKNLERNAAGRIDQQSVVSSEPYYANGNFIEEDFKVDTFEYRLLREVEFREQVTRLRPGDAREETEEIEQMPGPITAPTITQKPRNSKVLEGSDGIFTVKISGNPNPK